ncbi:MAG: hypothetical protein JO337_08890 [Acidimicrobiales bacterium]|nr:hypothetical protein [Acidimicrobiales bacterium]
MPERQDRIEFVAPPEPPPLTTEAAKLLAELIRRAAELEPAERGSSAA